VLKLIHGIWTETLGEHAPSYDTVTNWVARFKCGDFSTCDAPCRNTQQWKFWLCYDCYVIQKFGEKRRFQVMLNHRWSQNPHYFDIVPFGQHSLLPLEECQK